MVTLANVDRITLSSILISEPLALVPSDSDTPLYIHERLLSSVSPALGAACQGRWEESTSRVYKFLKDDNGSSRAATTDSLICFIRWAYFGDYSTESVGISSVVEERALVEDKWHTSWEVHKRTVTGRKCSICGGQNNHVEDSPPIAPDSIPPSDRYETSIEENAQSADHTNDPDTGNESRPEAGNCVSPLLLHIQLYVFANIYLIDSLKAVTKRKIIEYLRKVENSSSRGAYTAMIFELLEHASSYVTDDDSMLDWLARYASWHLTALKEDVERFGNLLRQSNGKFARLLIRHVVPSQSDPFTSAL